ncbi:MAG: P-type conjugative transfer protein VirB9 [Gammaproteobacteria bacterium]|nr:P-type conjugative transfer protein VirB9 [Gammaproteobacteria bacterium]
MISNTTWKYLLLLVSITLALPVYSGSDPIAGGADHRVKIVPYHPTDVTHLLGHYNYNIIIEYAPDELITKVAVGDSTGWHAEPLGHRLSLKPSRPDNTTNMFVATNKRNYNYELIARKTTNPRDKRITYSVKYTYPEEQLAKASRQQQLLLQQQKRQKVRHTKQGLSATNLNFNYHFSGDQETAPIQAFDDGTFTYFKFAKNKPLPAVLTVDKQRNEEVLNFRMEGGYMVVERLSDRFSLRHGNLQTSIVKLDASTQRPPPSVSRKRKETSTASGEPWQEQWAGW